MLEVGMGLGCLDIFLSPIISLSFLPPSGLKPKTTNQPHCYKLMLLNYAGKLYVVKINTTLHKIFVSSVTCRYIQKQIALPHFMTLHNAYRAFTFF